MILDRNKIKMQVDTKFIFDVHKTNNFLDK